MFDDIESCFAPSLLSETNQNAHKDSYAASTPYRHAVVDGLINPELLKKAREEILEELRFAEKETDIYKVNQTGDLANLDGLPAEEAKRLTHLLKVRNSIYSKEFRDWLQRVTGCGPLSEKKKDMSINDYRQGCHLLNHDDVISTRRLSYILYLPDPTKDWRPEWGGALELYPVKEKNEPAETPSKIIPPKWNQYTFFAVQPGHSFHSVEEVAHPTESRLSISGWFHRPQEDEAGYDPQDEIREENDRKELSSLESLSSKKAALPFIPYPTSLEPPFPGSKLSTLDKKFLSFFINPAYLTEKTQSILFEKFGDESHSLLSDVLKKEVAEVLEKGLRSQDSKDGFKFWESGTTEKSKIQDHQTGVEILEKEKVEWKINGPPHRQRYLTLQDLDGDNATISNENLEKNPPLPVSLPTNSSELLKLIKNSLFPSPAFRNWLANLTQLIPMSLRKPEVRRFRPGLDYTLARSDDEVILDVTLGLTPKVWNDPTAKKDSKPKGLSGKNKKAKTISASADGEGGLSKKLKKDLESKWENGEIGGWECYMAPHEGEEDPAVYQSAASRKAEADEQNGQEAEAAGEDQEMKDGEDQDQNPEEEHEDEDDEEDDEDFDGVLLNLTPDFNVLNIALRDEGVMRFVKYLSASAGGSRWDVSGEFTCGSLEEESEAEEQ